MRLRCLISCIVAATISVTGFAGQELSAEITLTGAQIYSAQDNSDGAIGIRKYRYTTNSADNTGFALSVDGDDSKATSIVLALGDNVFSFSGSVAPVDPGSYVGLNLFFTDTDSLPDDSFNPETISGVAGDLTVVTEVNSSSDAFSNVGAGIEVQTFDVDAIGVAFSNGQRSFSLGTKSVSVTAFTVANTPYNPSGSFTLTVVPEPTSSSVLGLVSAVWLIARRRQMVAGL